jgi:hypothetical protein
MSSSSAQPQKFNGDFSVSFSEGTANPARSLLLKRGTRAAAQVARQPPKSGELSDLLTRATPTE